MGMYYKRYEFQRRWSMFFVSGQLAGAVNGVRCFDQVSNAEVVLIIT